jgi:acyl transferase domain-containing protein
MGVFIESSPHPVLAMPIEDTVADLNATATVHGSIRRDDGGLGRLLACAAQVFAAGVSVNWSALFSTTHATRIPLPTYAFQRQHFWLTCSAEDVAHQLRHADELAAAGMSDEQIADELNVSVTTLHNWQSARAGTDVNAASEMEELREENARLRRQLADAEMENRARSRKNDQAVGP